MTEISSDFDLCCWYLNQRHIMDLIGANALAAQLRYCERNFTGHQLRMAQNSVYKDAFSEWLTHSNPPTLGKLIVSEQLKVGQIFTAYTNFWCKGRTVTFKAKESGKFPVPPMLAYAKLDDLRPGLVVECPFSHEHMTSDSSWGELSGQKTLFVAASITKILDKKIIARPYVIAYPITDQLKKQTLIGARWFNKLQVFVDDIETFRDVRECKNRFKPNDLSLLKGISEQDIKLAFAEIIGEPSVPKDWGGERSDLFSTMVMIEGKRVSAAFAFKGPAKFEPMKAAHLGKNGDQIYRLFSEPADLLVLQHCHEITPPVRAQMRAHAQQIGDLRLFCIIDGYDTLRLLKSYRKLCFS